MTRYDWPNATSRDGDDRDGRAAHNAALNIRHGAELFTPPTAGHVAAAAPSANANLWSFIGPVSSLGGQPADDGRVSGRVVDVAFEPTKGLRGYAASATGGVWYTEDAGSSWRPLDAFITGPTTGTRTSVNPLSCGALLVEFGSTPDDPSGDIVWVGTGEGNTVSSGMPGGELSGIGVLRGDHPATRQPNDTSAFVVEATNLSAKGCFRFVRDPAGTLVVATTAGLFERPTGGGPFAVWTLATNHPMTAPAAPATPAAFVCIDALVTPAVGGKPARLWALFIDGDMSTVEIRYRDQGATTFNTVLVDDGDFTILPTGAGALAASSDGSLVWLITQGPRLYRIDTTVSTPEGKLVKSTPTLWNGDALGSKMAIAVDPTNASRVALGGTFKKGDNTAASIFCGVVKKTGSTFAYPTEASSYCGDFVHPDVMSIHFEPDGTSLWVSCDGGVYHSKSSGVNGTFVARNDGLAVLECGFVASHPAHDGAVVAGLQDNGVQRRIGETVWRHDRGGDGGGMAFDLVRTDRYTAQYIKTDWAGGLNPALPPIQREGHPKAMYEDEQTASSFYSSPSTILKNPNTTQLALGTNRVWYTEDWGANWQTLPTNKDARPKPKTPDPKKVDKSVDVLPGGTPAIRVCRWETKDRLWVITIGALYRYERDGAGQWTRTEQLVHPLLSRHGSIRKRRIIGDTPTGGPVAKSGTWIDLAVHTATTDAGKLGTLYLATAGVPTDSAGDQLFWFDGVSTWHSVGLRSRTTAAALAVAVEPSHPDDVYVGTTIGVFKATLVMDGTTPQWDWTRLDNGLPDVAVQDLSIYSHDGVRLLRAATQARGVWELELGGPVTPRTYVRVHELDTRRRQPTPLAQPFTAKVGGKAVDYAWHASPDVQVHPKLDVVPAPASLPWTNTKHPATATDPAGIWRLWQFQAALRNLNARSEPNGAWPSRFDDVLRRAGAPLAGGKRAVTAAFWNTVMTPANVNGALPWDAPRPSEADLIEWLPTVGGTNVDAPSWTVPAGPVTVQVMVHDRGFPASPKDKVKVALLQFAVGKWVGKKAGAWAPGNVGWTAAIDAFLNSNVAPSLPVGWSLVPAGAGSVPAAEVAAGSPQAVSFDTTLAGPAGTLYLLVVVVWSDKDKAGLTEQSLRDLTLNDHHVAVRSVSVT
jgi:hypothetical protein